MAGVGFKILDTAQDGCARTSSREEVLIENSKAQQLQSLAEHGKLDQFHGKNDPMEIENEKFTWCKENDGVTRISERNVSLLTCLTINR